MGHALRAFLVSLLTVACLPQVVSAAGVVTTNTESALVAAMTGGGTVTFGFNGTIYLTNAITVSNNTVLDATGQNVAISGSNAVQIFIVNPATTLVLTNLTLRDGLAEGTFYSVDFPPTEYFVSPGCGGAISNAGTLQAYACTFTNNGAQGGSSFQFDVDVGGNDNAEGGAIYNIGTAQICNCVFSDNWASGGAASTVADFGGMGAGGALYNGNQIVLADCIFSNNAATGGAGCFGYNQNIYITSGSFGPGGAAGPAAGGAVCNNGHLILCRSTFALNGAIGGIGGAAGENDQFGNPPEPGYTGGSGGNAYGGALCATAGTGIIVNCTFWSNAATGGAGGPGGAGGLSLPGSGLPDGPGGDGGLGSNALGGAICGLSGGLLFMTNITVASNTVTAGAGGLAAPGEDGGDPGTNGASGSAMGCSLADDGTTNRLKNSILSADISTDTNIVGPLIDAGNNISFDDQDSLTNSTSYNGINPLLAPLGNYGGLTPTMALLPGSPAIDHADIHAFPPTDQRGHPRPYGPAPDIGAFEYAPANMLISGAYSSGQLHLAYEGTNGQTYCIQTSVNFSQWYPIATNTIGVSGYQDLAYAVTNLGGQYFRAVSP